MFRSRPLHPRQCTLGCMKTNTFRDSRRDGIHRARRVSNWTAAFLLAVTGGSAAALARQASHPVAAATSGTVTAGQAAGGPHVPHSVATTTASGVTVTTTTQTVNGKTIVTQVRSGHPRWDD